MNWEKWWKNLTEMANKPIFEWDSNFGSEAEPIEIHLWIAERQWGPFSNDEIFSKLKRREINPETLCSVDGGEWGSIRERLPDLVGSQTPKDSGEQPFKVEWVTKTGETAYAGTMLALFGALGLTFFAFFYDTAPNGTHNLGLMSNREIGAIASIGFMILGGIFCAVERVEKILNELSEKKLR